MLWEGSSPRAVGWGLRAPSESVAPELRETTFAFFQLISVAVGPFLPLIPFYQCEVCGRNSVEGSPLDGKSCLAAGVVVQGWGTSTHRHPQTPTNIHRHPLFPRELAGASVAFQQQQNQSSLPCLCSMWEVAAGGSLPCGGTGNNGAASLINSGSGWWVN